MIKLERLAYTSKATIGVIRTGERPIYTLECPWKGNERNVSCVPEGTYVVGIDQEGKYTGYLELQDVPGRSEIILHPANHVSQLEGCIAPGFSVRETLFKSPSVWDSRAALKELRKHLHPGDTLTITSNFDFSGLQGSVTAP